MPPLLKPSECSLVIVGYPELSNVDDAVSADRARILRAAVLCGVPTFRAVLEHSRQFSHEPLSENQVLYGSQEPGGSWCDTPLSIELARTNRASLLICGYWLDEAVTFTALNALGEGYDIYLLVDASPSLDMAERHTAILRLVQAGIVPTTTRQALREWATEISDTNTKGQLLALL